MNIQYKYINCKVFVMLTLLGGVLTAADRSGAENFGEAIEPFLKAYCIGCHGPSKQKGDFRVDHLKFSTNASDVEKWQLVLDNLQLGDMPPNEAKQPELSQIEAVTTWIQAELKRAVLAFGWQNGEVVLRRLNRLEYENSIEDLFDVRGDYAVGFPEDAISGSFNNNGAALSLSSEQIDQYLRAADFILSRAIVTSPKPQTKSISFTLENIEKQQRQREVEREKQMKKNSGYTPTSQEVERRKREQATGNSGRPYFPKHGDDSLIPVRYLKPDTSNFFKVREAGWYRYQVIAYPVRHDGQPMRLEVSYGSGEKEEIPTVVDVIQLTDPAPMSFEYRVYLQPGHRIALEMLDGTNWLPGSRIEADESPAIAIKKIEIEGPLIEQWPPRGHQVLLGKLDPTMLEDAAVPQLLRDFAPKLFRRPVEASIVDEYIDFYQARRTEVPPLEAFKVTVKAMMTSPLFLYHYEPSDRVDEHALANRLAYFLWRSMPDEQLLDLAEKGMLSRPTVLEQQTSRLLADAKSERFVKDFVGQWLQTDKVGEMQPDKGLYPEYDEELERAMVQETLLFVREMLVNDLSITNVIDSDWTILNDRLARHYGITGVEGNHFRKVSLNRSHTIRGGLLTHASILCITSNGTTTSPGRARRLGS